MIHVKRAYDPVQPEDGRRFLVDRLWPRGVKKEALKIEGWPKEVAPSDSLRRWYHHEPDHWEEFRQRYIAELESRPETWETLVDAARKGDITLLYSARDTQRNNAIVLKEFLEKRL